MVETLHLPSYAIRPGVTFPDWSAVTSPRTCEALLAIFQALDLDRMSRNYTPTEDRVRTALLRLYVEVGRAPAIGDVAARAGVDEASVRSILESLKARDLVVLEADGDRIAGAYPFTDNDTEHRVTLGAATLRAMCAIDALGVGAMCGQDVEISSKCRFCGAPITITTDDLGRTLGAVDPATVVIWSGTRYEDGCAATSMCTTIAFFCSDGHLEAWRAAQNPKAPGLRLSIDEALQAGRAVFGPSLAGPDEHW